MQNSIQSFLNSSCKRLRFPSVTELPFSDINYLIEKERIPHGDLISVWFRSKGCFYHKSGSCTMCAYDDGHSTNVTSNQIKLAIDEAIEKIKFKKKTCLLFSPTGSLLDSRELPDSVLFYLLKRINELPINEFVFETRIETISASKLDILKKHISSIELTIESGVESVSQIISSCCINKPFHKNLAKKKIKLINDYGFNFIGNLFIGAPFMAPNEMIKDVVDSIRWLIENGTQKVILLPIQLRKTSLLYWLFQNGRYTPPSLWEIKDVLLSLPEKLCRKVSISCYNKDFFDNSIVKYADTCPSCRSVIFPLLDEFRKTENQNNLEKLNAVKCSCRLKWEQLKKTTTNKISHLNLIQEYEFIARQLMGQNYWKKNSNHIDAELETKFKDFNK